MIDNIIINKSATILRCIDRIREEYGGTAESLANITKQDSIVLNLQRACEASIDLAMHIVSERGYGVPQSSRDAFDLLQRNGVVGDVLCARLKAMVGFRNVAIHDYQAIQIPILQSILDRHLDDFVEFTSLFKPTTR